MLSLSMQYVLKALAAGKAVLSEKPISACFADAKKAIEASRKFYRPLAPKPLWFVAENFRFESVFEEAARLVSLCGAVQRVDLVAEAPLNYWYILEPSRTFQNMLKHAAFCCCTSLLCVISQHLSFFGIQLSPPSSSILHACRYFSSKWRTKQSAHAFMIHSSVHHMAALRMLAGATSATRATSVRALTLYDHQPLLRSNRSSRHMHEGHPCANTHALEPDCEDDMVVDYPGAEVVPQGTATGVSARLTWDSGLVSNVWLCMIASSVRVRVPCGVSTVFL